MVLALESPMGHVVVHPDASGQRDLSAAPSHAEQTHSRASPHPAEQPLRPFALTLMYPDQLLWEEGNFGWGSRCPLSLGLRSPCIGGPHHLLRGPLSALHLNSSLTHPVFTEHLLCARLSTRCPAPRRRPEAKSLPSGYLESSGWGPVYKQNYGSSSR